MENIERTIDRCAAAIKDYRETIEVLNWLSTLENLPGTAGITVAHGVWVDLTSIDEWKALRRILGCRMISTYPHTLDRNDTGQVKISYQLSIEPFTHEEVEAATWSNGYISNLSLKSGHPAPVVHFLVCINPGPECKKVIRGTKEVEIIEWVCEEAGNGKGF